MDSKIGIVTLTGRFNYGNRLQLFASISVYRQRGFTPVYLELKPKLPLFERVGRVLKNSLRRCKGQPPLVSSEKFSTKERLEAFDRFDALFETCRLTDCAELDVADYKYISVGSDQVWGCSVIVDRYGKPAILRAIYKKLDQKRFDRFLEWYFLGFCPREKRIALAPSVGLDTLDDSQTELLACGVLNFDRISVRERRGAELIKECSGMDAEVICDPTLVLPAEEWRAVADGRLTPDAPYVFTYLLGGVGAEAADVLDRVTDHGRIPVIPLSDRQKPGEPDAGPAEFIDLIDHAAHVVTDSFHAAVFSSILQTPLTIVHREGGASMFSRLEQLSEMLGIEEKVYGSPTYDLARAGEYDGVPEAIEREREKFMTYLEGCLDG